jgi:hypothetical protein
VIKAFLARLKLCPSQRLLPSCKPYAHVNHPNFGASGPRQSAIGNQGMALALFGQATLNPPRQERDTLKTKALFHIFECSFFCFSRQILQMFMGNCEPHRSKTGFVRHLSSRSREDLRLSFV